MRGHTIPSGFGDCLDRWARRAYRAAPTKKVCHNTYMRCEVSPSDGKPLVFHVVYHATAILSWHRDGSVTLNSGGWRTVTTKARINDGLRGFGWSVVSKRVPAEGYVITMHAKRRRMRSEWWLMFEGEEYCPFSDRITLMPDRPEVVVYGSNQPMGR